MIDIHKQIAYWRNSAAEDWDVAFKLVNSGKTRHGLFFAHLALEKILKAHVCRQIQDLAPRIHGLLKLAEIADISLDQTQIDVLADISNFNIEGRYPELLVPPPTKAEARRYLQRAREIFQWLMSQL